MRDGYTYQCGRYIHSACVVLDGEAIILPGESGVGKTTLTLKLLGAGAKYCSDELAELDGGLVYPYPKPLYIRSPKLGYRRVFSPPLSWVAPLKWFRVSTVVFPRRGSKDRLRVLPKPEALLLLGGSLLREKVSREDLECLKQIVLQSKTCELEWLDPALGAQKIIEASTKGWG